MTEPYATPVIESFAHNRGCEEETSGEPVRSPRVTIIEPRSRWRLVDWKELIHYRDLFRFFVCRDVKVRYAQSALGIGWAVIQPLVTMIIFTVVFGNLAELPSDGLPYAVFSLAALVPWTYFANALTSATDSLVSQANVISKIYFPRVLLPLAAVAARLVDLAIGLVILVGVAAWFAIVPSATIAVLPVLIVLMMLTAAGLGLWLTALAIQYRDVKHATQFIVQLLMYASPVVYPVSLIPKPFQPLYAINPMVGVIEGFRASLANSRSTPWDLLAIGIASAIVIAVTGLIYFHSRERVFADVA
jgi:lipopolysaccharide transport system permease protein